MRELEQCKKERSTLKKIILRKDMARRVKQCDGKISNLLQTFEVRRWYKFVTLALTIVCRSPWPLTHG
jgi:hypothetical protein